MKRLLLAGGGHAHRAVLQALAKGGPTAAALEVTLVTPRDTELYSGMIPGWIAGHYTLAEATLSLRPLAQKARVNLEINALRSVDPRDRRVELEDGRTLPYDLLSLDIGGAPDPLWLGAGPRALQIHPLSTFVTRWQAIVDAPRAGLTVLVVGGGAAGVELSLAVNHALRQRGLDPRVALVAGEQGVLAEHAPPVVARVRRALEEAGISVHARQGAPDRDGVLLSDGSVLKADHVLIATGAQPHPWLRHSGLALDAAGYVAVDATHRSLSHETVFAAGDTCSRPGIDGPLARSGVHAVKAGPVLAHNLLAALAGKPLREYQPRRRTLYLLAQGPRRAIASWGGLGAAGAWVWQVKRWIDRQYVQCHRV